MVKQKRPCKYCGSLRYTGDICSHCAEKLRLIRKLQAMIRAEKQREEARRQCTTSNKSNNE